MKQVLYYLCTKAKDIDADRDEYYPLQDCEDELPILFVSEVQEFAIHGGQSDWTPLEAFDELERLGYSACEMVEAMLQFIGPVNEMALEQALKNSPVFIEDPLFTQMIMEYWKEI